MTNTELRIKSETELLQYQNSVKHHLEWIEKTQKKFKTKIKLK